jgi:hypothetical protein
MTTDQQLTERWRQVTLEMVAATRRIREQVRNIRCRCHLEPEFVTKDGRCGRCYGRREGRP